MIPEPSNEAVVGQKPAAAVSLPVEMTHTKSSRVLPSPVASPSVTSSPTVSQCGRYCCDGANCKGQRD